MKKISLSSLALTVTVLLILLGGGVWANIKITKNLPDPTVKMVTQPTNQQTAIFAGGCFWGMEAIFEHLQGVSDVVSGFAGGAANTATYAQVSTGTTGHAEGVKVTYDPTKISYAQLLKVFFSVAHDPTHVNRQGVDVGTQYRSAIFATTPDQEKVAKAYIEQLRQAKAFKAPIVTEVNNSSDFYPAEEYHQDFVKNNPLNPYVVVHDLPKIERFKQQFASLYKP